jgi:hypothetical protein
MRDTSLLAVLVQLLATAYTEAGLQAVGRIIDAGVNDSGIARGRFLADAAMTLDDQCLETGRRQRSPDCEADDASADHDGIDNVR